MGVVIPFPVRQIVRTSINPVADPMAAHRMAAHGRAEPVQQNGNYPDYDFALNVDGLEWVATNLGADAASAYITMSRGCTYHMRTTLWSVSACERRSGMSHVKAKAAVEALIDSGVVAKTKHGSRPAYRLLDLAGRPDIRRIVHNFSANGGPIISAVEEARLAGDASRIVDVIRMNSRDIRRRQG